LLRFTLNRPAYCDLRACTWLRFKHCAESHSGPVCLG
jgi:hypothetical protein